MDHYDELRTNHYIISINVHTNQKLYVLKVLAKTISTLMTWYRNWAREEDVKQYRNIMSVILVHTSLAQYFVLVR